MRILACAFLILYASGCSTISSGASLGANLATYGTGGAVLGAGAGAAVRAIRGAGGLAESMAIGAASGIAAGLALGAIESSDKSDEIERVSVEIDQNEAIIQKREYELELIRQSASDQAQREEINPEYEERIYTGPTLGVYYR